MLCFILVSSPAVFSLTPISFSQGVRCKRVARSISSVGLYVPGGTAVLPSTALMLSVVRRLCNQVYVVWNIELQL